jgi:heat shock protein HslJ
MHRTLAAIILAALIVGGLAACQPKPTAVPAPTEALFAETLATSTPQPTATAMATVAPTRAISGPVSIEGAAWSLVSYGNPALPTKVLSGTNITAGFVAGTLVGNAGCNDYNSTYNVFTDTIKIALPVGAGKQCAAPEGIMAQEAQYLQFLEAVTKWTATADLMELKSADSTISLLYQRATSAKP